MFKKIIFLTFLCLTACGDEEKKASDNQNKLAGTSIIPRKVLFGNPDKMAVKISPDGTLISYLAPRNGVLNVFVAPINDPKKEKVITDDVSRRGIRNYTWSYDSKYIIYGQDINGDEKTILYSVAVETREKKQLTRVGSKSGIAAMSLKFPEEIMVYNNLRNNQYFDIYRVNIASGKNELIYQNDQYRALSIDNDFRLRFAEKKLKDNASEIYAFDSLMNATLFDSMASEDADLTGIMNFDKTGTKLYMLDSRLGDKVQFVVLDIATKKKKLVLKSKKADIVGAVLHPTDLTVQAVTAEHTKNEWRFVDSEFKKEFEYLQTLHTGEVDIHSRSLDDKQWIVVYQHDDKPLEYYRYDRDKKQLEFLFFHKEDLNNYKLHKMEPVVIKSRDGLELVSYLTRPETNEPVPMVLSVHGGPSARDGWGLDSEHQWLANRGYAVLSVNYRGSTGFGRKFFNAGHGEWAAKIHDDLLDGVQWAIDNGITTKDKVAIMGASYGGYSALVGLTFTPDVFACGVDIVGMSNLVTFHTSIPAYWQPSMNFLIKMTGGDATTEEGRKILELKSPLTFADRIKKPLLIGHGYNDPRVKKTESDQIVAKMKQHNIPVTYVLYPDEGHGFSRPENRLSFRAITEQFLAKNMGGRAEEIGNDMENSSYEIIEGGEELGFKYRLLRHNNFIQHN